MTEDVEVDIETRAASMGWKPKDQLADDKEFVDAKEFIARKPLFDKIRAQNEKIHDVEKTLKDTSAHVLKVQELAYKKAMSDLQKDRAVAIKEADIDRVQEIDAELSELHNDKPEPAPPPEYLAWEGENKWFKEDEELFAFACANFAAQMKRTPNANVAKVLELVSKATKRAYPEKFESENPHIESEKPHIPNIEGGSKPVNHAKQPSYSSLNENQKRVCDNFVKLKIMTRDDYIKSLVEIGEI